MTGPTWKSDAPPAPAPRIGPAGWARVLARGSALALLNLGGVGIILLVRLVERPLCGLRRPLSRHVAVVVSRNALRVLGIAYRTQGRLMKHPGAIVANHSSWLDIYVLNAGGPIHFVAKAEVAGWPGIGWVARAVGTLFIRREAREARAQRDHFEARLHAGHRLLFFPEGTSTDGRRILPFKPTLFSALFADAHRDGHWLQPATVVYVPPEGEEPRYYGWWGDMAFGEHVLKILAGGRGRVEVTWHAPVRVADFADRKALARAAEAAVRAAHPAGG